MVAGPGGARRTQCLHRLLLAPRSRPSPFAEIGSLPRRDRSSSAPRSVLCTRCPTSPVDYNVRVAEYGSRRRAAADRGRGAAYSRPQPQPRTHGRTTERRSRQGWKARTGEAGRRAPTSTEVRHMNVPFSHPSEGKAQKDGRKVRWCWKGTFTFRTPDEHPDAVPARSPRRPGRPSPGARLRRPAGAVEPPGPGGWSGGWVVRRSPPGLPARVRRQ